jgi:ectoine hydroxylase-related dioxygenase (phytanoyl-CoA dioxygenase family)
MGLVRYWRGSHKSGTIYKVNYFISDKSDDDQGVPVPEITGHESDFDLVEFSPEPGDVVVHHLATVHGAGGNASATTPRRAITIRYGGDDVRYKFRRFAPPQDTVSPILRDGDLLDGDPDRFPRANV